MRLALSGTASTGKSTLIKDFLVKWPNYTTNTTSYREKLKALNLPHSKKCTQETQWAILNHMVDEMQKFDKNSNVIFDRCPLDNIVY